MTRQLGYLMMRALRDLRPRPYPVAREFRTDGRGAYPLDLRPLATAFRLGSDKVVTVAGPDGCSYRNPVSVSLYALSRHTAAGLEQDWPVASAADAASAAGALFLTQARYLRSSQDADGGWRYPVPVRRYGVTPGWYSAMAQGLAISVLLRAQEATGEASYGDAASAAAALLLRPLDAGGCADYDQAGRPFLEECPSEPPCHILNGALFALIGLCEHQTRAGGAAHMPAAVRIGGELATYDLGYWSRYDQRFAAPATLAYHSLHISLLEAIARLCTDDDDIRSCYRDTAASWRSYLRHPGNRLRAMTGKARFVLQDSRG
jgi:heparosan-N-sulfate-glucuronate 5-epimerase